jgi:hypothetical protein
MRIRPANPAKNFGVFSNFSLADRARVQSNRRFQRGWGERSKARHFGLFVVDR